MSGDAPAQKVPPPAAEVELDTEAERKRAERHPRFKGFVRRGDRLSAVFDGKPDRAIIKDVKDG